MYHIYLITSFPFFLAGMSEDSDYTSDVNFPVQHHHNSSAHQFRGEHQFRLQHEDSKEYYNNESFDRGYEREPDYYQDGGMYYPGRSDTDSEPLYYNSRPNSRPQSFVNDRYTYTWIVSFSLLKTKLFYSSISAHFSVYCCHIADDYLLPVLYKMVDLKFHLLLNQIFIKGEKMIDFSFCI